MTLKEARIKAGFKTQQILADKFKIPKRSIENWESGVNKRISYGEKALLEKLEDMIMLNAQEVLKKAMEINAEVGYHKYLPELKVGDAVELNDVWDGNGDIPEESYSYLLTHDGDKWGDVGDINLVYFFDVVEEKENPLDTLVKITNIDFC